MKPGHHETGAIYPAKIWEVDQHCLSIELLLVIAVYILENLDCDLRHWTIISRPYGFIITTMHDLFVP